MSLISGSNSLTPPVAGALDFRAAIVEKVLGCSVVELVLGAGSKLCEE